MCERYSKLELPTKEESLSESSGEKNDHNGDANRKKKLSEKVRKALGRVCSCIFIDFSELPTNSAPAAYSATYVLGGLSHW